MEMYVRCMSGACMYAEGKEEDSHRQDKRWRTSTKNACAGGCSRVYDLNGGQISVLGYHSVDRRRAPRQPPTRKQSRPDKQNTRIIILFLCLAAAPRANSCLTSYFHSIILRPPIHRSDRLRHTSSADSQPAIADTWCKLHPTALPRQQATLTFDDGESRALIQHSHSHFHLHPFRPAVFISSSNPPSIVPLFLSARLIACLSVCLTASCRQHALDVFAKEGSFSQSRASSSLHSTAPAAGTRMHAPMFPARNRPSDASPKDHTLTVLM